MTQNATVRRVVDGKNAEICVQRASACGHSCAQCGGCKTHDRPHVVALAENAAGAAAGDRVVVESATAHVLGLAAAVYLLPFLFFFLLYFLGTALMLSQLASLALGGAGLLSGIGLCLLLNRQLSRRTAPAFRIITIARD